MKLEAILFVSEGPVSLEDILSMLEGKEQGEINTLVERLNKKLDGHAIEIVPIAGGFQLRTRPDLAETIKAFHKLERSTRLSPAALEVLSIVAYRQPITRQEIEDIRGVDSSGVVTKLLDRSLIKSMGRRKIIGKPMTFGTTNKFLEYFGLVKLSDMPMLKDFSEEENIDVDVLQKGLDLQIGERKPKEEEDLRIEEEAAMIEPAEEDYEDADEEDEDTEEMSEDADDLSEDADELSEEAEEINDESDEETGRN
jgi:segregation and condensation protein B